MKWPYSLLLLSALAFSQGLAQNTVYGIDVGTGGHYSAHIGTNAGSIRTGYNNIIVGYGSNLHNTKGTLNTFLDTNSGYFNLMGQGNLFVGYSAGNNNTTDSGNSMLGHLANSPNSASFNNAAVIGNKAYVSRSNSLILGSISGVNGATSNVNVGIGIHAPTCQLQLSASSAAKLGSSNWTVASDEQLKTQITTFTDGLEVLLQIKSVEYHYNGKAQMPTDKEYVGVIVQEIKLVAPYMAREFTYQDTTGKEEKYLDYDASTLTYVLDNAVKELKKENKAKDSQITTLQNQLSVLEQKVAQLIQQKSGKGSAAARVGKNIPSPATGATRIPYFLPESVQQAEIVLFDVKGRQVSTDLLLNRGTSELTLSSKQLPTGTYPYQLQVDGPTGKQQKDAYRSVALYLVPVHVRIS
jgi:hypothetical protein